METKKNSESDIALIQLLHRIFKKTSSLDYPTNRH